MSSIKPKLALFLMLITPVGFATQWGYVGEEGPSYWGSLDPAYKVCATGQQQSPIDITQTTAIKDQHLILHYHNSAFNLYESAHNLYQNSVKTTKNYVVYNGHRYDLVQIHFHVPSEHHINGKHYPIEAHLVHKNSKKELLVLAVFLKVGDSNKYLATLYNSAQFAELPEELEGDVQLNPADLVGEVNHYYIYRGSLTTPPCIEGVTWLINQQVGELSAQQLATFKAKVNSFNARPIQSLNDRPVYCDECS